MVIEYSLPHKYLADIYLITKKNA